MLCSLKSLLSSDYPSQLQSHRIITFYFSQEKACDHIIKKSSEKKLLCLQCIGLFFEAIHNMLIKYMPRILHNPLLILYYMRLSDFSSAQFL